MNGAPPAGLMEAESAMGEAGQSLGDGAWDQAAAAEGQALQRLQETIDQLGRMGSGGMVPRDPMGRPLSGNSMTDDGTTKIPDHAEIQRARQILDELRRRAGDWQRPEPEREYLRRLLQQF